MAQQLRPQIRLQRLGRECAAQRHLDQTFCVVLQLWTPCRPDRAGGQGRGHPARFLHNFLKGLDHLSLLQPAPQKETPLRRSTSRAMPRLRILRISVVANSTLKVSSMAVTSSTARRLSQLGVFSGELSSVRETGSTFNTVAKVSLSLSIIVLPITQN